MTKNELIEKVALAELKVIHETIQGIAKGNVVIGSTDYLYTLFEKERMLIKDVKILRVEMASELLDLDTIEPVDNV